MSPPHECRRARVRWLSAAQPDETDQRFQRTLENGVARQSGIIIDYTAPHQSFIPSGLAHLQVLDGSV
jgi:hypothetical protein